MFRRTVFLRNDRATCVKTEMKRMTDNVIYALKKVLEGGKQTHFAYVRRDVKSRVRIM